MHIRDEKVLEPFSYLGQILGKNVRGVLIDCFQEWIAIPEEKMEIIKVQYDIELAVRTTPTRRVSHLSISSLFPSIVCF